jgi:dTDP-4-dehydrorhamnose 3,5-epimerase
MSRLTVTALPLAGLKRVQRHALADPRGTFARVFCADELAAAGWRKPVVQINHARTIRRGTVRGMHYQEPPHAEMKLVSCLRGRVFDVAVDLRYGSPTFGRWHAEELSADDGGAMLLPEGFAHGFQALSDDVELLYCHTVAHAPAADAGVSPLDDRLNIRWPLPVALLSARDQSLPGLDTIGQGVAL